MTAARSDRIRRFRSRHREDELVTGRFLRFEDDRRGWVRIDDQDLLAALSTSPSPGQTLFFKIKQLYPEIVLQEVYPVPPGKDSAARLLQDFYTARTAFENPAESQPGLPAPETGPQIQNPGEFIASLTTDRDRAEYLKVLIMQNRINALTREIGWEFSYAPWLLPGAGQFELLIRSAGEDAGDEPLPKHARLYEIICGFVLKNLGRCETRMLYQNGRARYQVFTEKPEHADRLITWLGERVDKTLGPDVKCLDVGLLPAESRAGVLAWLLAPLETAPRINLRV